MSSIRFRTHRPGHNAKHSALLKDSRESRSDLYKLADTLKTLIEWASRSEFAEQALALRQRRAMALELTNNHAIADRP